MKLCFFGMYNKYDDSGNVRSPRDEIIIEGLKRNGVPVVECNFPVPKTSIEIKGKASFLLARAQLLFREWSGYFKVTREFFSKRAWDSDTIIVGWPWKFDIFIAFFLSRVFRKPLVFDMFNSLFETDVLDRAAVKRNSFRARYFHFLDWLACSAADVVLMDTDAHKDFLVKEFGIPEKKIRRLFIGSDDRIFFPQKHGHGKTGSLSVFFVGTNIPLQGIGTIFDAAELLKNEREINFLLAGVGHFPEWRERLEKSGLKNVSLFGLLKPKECAQMLSQSDIALGIFGITEKAERVIPHKAFEAMACAKPLVTQVSPAALEIFSNKKDSLLIKAGDAKALAEAIMFLKNNPAERKKISENSFSIFRENCSPDAIGLELIGIIGGFSPKQMKKN